MKRSLAIVGLLLAVGFAAASQRLVLGEMFTNYG